VDDDAPVLLRACGIGGPRERSGVERRLALARVEAGLQLELLARAVELPDAQPRRERDAGDRRGEDDDAAPA